MSRRLRALVADLAQDVRYAVRQWRLSPVFTLTALIILAAGASANCALFGVFDALVLRPLPVRAPDELVAFSAFDPKHPDYANLAPLEAFKPLRAAQTVFGDVSAFLLAFATVERDGTFSEIPIAFVDESYFSVLQVARALAACSRRTTSAARPEWRSSATPSGGGVMQGTPTSSARRFGCTARRSRLSTWCSQGFAR